MTLGEILKSKGYNITVAMSTATLVSTWDKLPAAIRDKFATITAAMVVLKAAESALARARSAYETASSVYTTAKDSMDTALQSIVPGPGQAVAATKATSTAQQAAAASADSSVDVSTAALSATVISTEVADADLPLFDNA